MMARSLREIIDESAERIVQCWAVEARKSVGGQGLSRTELLSRLPAFVASLVRSSDSDVDPDLASQRWLVDSHHADRLRQGFELPEMLDEFRILSDCIDEAWSGKPEADRPQAHEIERLRGELRTAEAAAKALFDHALIHDQQTEKQFLRRLQRVASDSMAGNARVPLGLRLHEMLEVISNALKAETTGLYIHEPERQQLRLVASTGGQDDLMGEYVTPLGAPSFASRLAGSGETLYVADVAKSGLEVPQPVRKAGARSILGMPLRSREVLLGALYVGFHESRVLEPREVRLFESLGERFALLLDDAQVHAALEETNLQLRTERELRDRFVAVLAHDLLGPLAAAKMGLQLLQTHPELLDSVPAQIIQDLDRTDGMVRDMLDVHQIRAGHRLTLRIAKTDLVMVTRDVVRELERLHGDRFIVKAAEHEWGFWSARDMRRMLWNLASNAIKYGSKTAPIEIRIVSKAGKVELAVHNDGPVIPAEERAALFEPFSRAITVQVAAQRGWGLGLTLVKGCVEAHGGAVDIASEDGAGTTFTLRFPVDARPFQPRATLASAV